MDTNLVLKDVLPHEFFNGGYDEAVAVKYLRAKVVKTYGSVCFDTTESKFQHKPWPGPQKYVNVWYVLDNGKAVGWNENPSKGWSFPVVSYTE